MGKIKVGIIGGAGYVAGELIRLLLHHELVEIIFIQSESNKGKPVCEVHKDLIGETILTFSEDVVDNVDVIFLCKGHGASRGVMDGIKISPETKIIDLSQDYRLDDSFVYGLPEVNQLQIEKANRVANPGCFATAIQLSLLPAVKSNLTSPSIHLSGITGSTGAGQSFSLTSHFSWRNNNISVYKPFTHQHLKEIDKTFKSLNNQYGSALNFIPYRGNFTRGIIISTYFHNGIRASELLDLYHDFYHNHPFTHVVQENPDLKQVVNTNKCLVYPTLIEGKVMVISILDNLLKGASGQALQNMNLMMGIDQTKGLKLKSIAY